MAEKIGFSVEVDGVERSITSVKELKKALADAKTASINGDGKAAKAIAELTDKMDDLKDATKAAQGTGIEKLKSSFALMVDGFKNFDGDKLKLAFNGIGTAMKAIPILLIVEGIRYLIENFDELSKGSGPLAKTLQFVGDALGYISDKIGAVINFFTDMAGATSDATRALEAQGKAIKTNSDQLTSALNQTIKKFDDQITVAKAAGKSTVDLEIAKQKAIIDTNLTIARQIEAFVRAGGELDEERKKILTASLDAIRGAKVTERVIELNDQKQKRDNYIKHLEEKRDAEDKARKERHAKELEEIKMQEDAEAYLAELDATKLRQKKENEDAFLAYQAEKLNISAQLAEEALERERLARHANQEEERAIIEASVSNAQNLASLTQNISDIAFNAKMAKVKKGSAEEEALMKRQFEINKKMQIAQVIISSATSAIEAYKSLAGIPIVGPVLGGIAAGVAVTAGIATVQKIRSTQFEGGGGGGISIPTGSGSVPSINTPQNSGGSNSRSTELDDDGNVTRRTKVEVVAKVYEGDVTRHQNRSSKLENQASFG